MNTQRSGHAAFGLGTRLCGSGADEFLIFQKKGRQSLPKRPFFLQVVKFGFSSNQFPSCPLLPSS